LATAIRGLADPVVADPTERAVHSAEDGQIVVVHSQVVETVGHVLGNMFQRIYHLIDLAGTTDSTTAAALADSTRKLEDFLQLVIDYFSPATLALQHVPAADVAQGLALQMSDCAGCAVKVDAKLPEEGRLLADPGRLARSFALLASRLRDDSGGDQTLTVRVVGETSGRCVRLTATLPARLVAAESSESEVRWAVAQKLLETHGGTLRQQTMPSGEVLWEIALPLQS
jgi:F420-0:gamma-glutamyl ligase